MMNYIKYALYLLLAILMITIWNVWEKEHPSVEATQQTVTTENASTAFPETKNITLPHTKNSPILPQGIPDDRLIHIKTDVLTLTLDKLGGNIVEASLPKYPTALNSNAPFVLMNRDPKSFYTASSGFVRFENQTAKEITVLYSAEKNNFTLEPYQNQLDIKLVGKTPEGLFVTKLFTFYPNDYKFTLDDSITNTSGEVFNGSHYLKLLQTTESIEHRGFFSLPIVKAIALSTQETPYRKITFAKLNKESLNKISKGGWIAMPLNYFIGAWAPAQNQDYDYYGQSKDNAVTAGAVGVQLNLQPHQSTTLHSTFYAGPKIAENLSSVAPHLDMTVDYGWLWFIAVPVFKTLKFIHTWVGNWGLAIILVTVLIKLLFYHLSATSYKSMAGMRKLQPKIQQLRERYGDDRQGMSKAMMELYKREKINPLGGCLPILIQIPVFIALYWVLLESIELRQAPFIFWLQDLSIKDPYYVLPLLMGVSMFIQQKLSPAPPDPAQAKVMMFLPIMMTAFFLNFPAGLVLYWLANNILSILQQWYITKQYEKKHTRVLH